MRLWNSLRGLKVGFSLDESMVGTHEFEPGMGPSGRHHFRFDVRWGPDDVRDWVRSGGELYFTQTMRGTLTAGHLCEGVPIEGALELKYLGSKSIRYAFTFDVDGEAYAYVGEKVNIRPWNLPVSHTTCFGVLTKAGTGQLVSRSLTFFRLRSLPAFLSSFRLHVITRGEPGSCAP